MERKLATIRKIDKLEPIEGADKIELAHVGGWKVVVAKDVGHKKGDLVIYCEIDSFLPIRDEFEFLRKSSFKRMGDKEGFRLKTIKLRKQISQGLILPISIFESYEYHPHDEFLVTDDFPDGVSCIVPNKVAISPQDMIPIGIGVDVTEILGIVKYDPPIPAQLSGKVKGSFPSFIKKTDEERLQNLKITDIVGDSYNLTEKLDGTSFTCYLRDGEFGVCSRNLELKEDDGNTHWKLALELELEEKLSRVDKNLAIQGEIIGEGIQKNRYGLKGQHLYVFNIFDIDKFEYLPQYTTRQLCEEFGLKTVPFINVVKSIPNGITTEDVPFVMDNLLEFAEGKSALNPKTEREGLVWRSTKRDFSFKTISNKFLLKGGD